mmetsp:Transcript_27674/g.65824  ORF Transcript_27674/g.65824 Transcript_27674/m.65824 type:complete len:1040 (+) Transcript_27674:188-3307(+)
MPRNYSSSFGGSGPKRGRGFAYSSSASSRKRSKKSPWECMKVPQLKKACKERLLSCKGKKADLVKRLQEYVVGVNGGGRKPPPSSYAAPISSATSGSSNNISVYGVNNKDDAEMIEVASKADSDRKPAAKPDSLSQLSQSSDASGASQLTEEQRERMRANREEALKRRRMSTGSYYDMSQDSVVDLRSSQAQGSTGLSQGSQGSRSKASNPYANCKTRSAPAPKVSPTVYRKRKRQHNDEENDDALAGLDNLPAGAPPIRVNTLNRLSTQQLAVIRSARPPSVPIVDGEGSIPDPDWMSTVPRKHMVRVNAAAGTGKTTTLLHLAARCIDLGHADLCYVTFTRASAKDARDRMQALLDPGQGERIQGSTLHACAMNLLNNERADNDTAELDKAVLDDLQFQNDVIKKHWGSVIEDFCQGAHENIRAIYPNDTEAKIKSRTKMVTDKALFYARKAFVFFCHSKKTLAELKDRNNKKRHYYPVTCEFCEGGKACKLGFPPGIYNKEKSWEFFADLAVEIWEKVTRDGIKTYDIEMKRAQLRRIKIPCSVLLVDECQDLDECQVDWVSGQARHGTHLYFVGDAAQCIYGFRGAKSSYVMKLDCIDRQLTKSWRFGPDVARIANIALFAKENSPQTSKASSYNPLWKPYRVEGARKVGYSTVMTESMAQNWRDHKPLTLLGMTNAGLMMKAMGLLGLDTLRKANRVCTDDDDELSVDLLGDESEEESNSRPLDSENWPRFHINGKGDNSGIKKWRKAMKEVRILSDLWSNRDQEGNQIEMLLPPKEFPDFANEPVTWDTFCQQCQEKELGRYAMAVSIVHAYEEKTPQALDSFEEHVMAKTYSEKEADIILTTCHSAKGLEWDRVELCPDLLDLNTASFTDTVSQTVRHPSFMRALPDDVESELSQSKGEKRKGWEFGLSSYSNDINLLYVGITRAKRQLSLPQSIKTLMEQMDLINFLVKSFVQEHLQGKNPSSSDESMLTLSKPRARKLTKGDVWDLYYDICLPLRTELGVPPTGSIVPHLFPECFDDDDEKDVKVKAETE